MKLPWTKWETKHWVLHIRKILYPDFGHIYLQHALNIPVMVCAGDQPLNENIVSP